jgi:hypothetical protein
MNAAEIGDLALSGTDRQVLWRALRERGQITSDVRGDASAFPWPDALDAFYETTKRTKEKLKGHEENN